MKIPKKLRIGGHTITIKEVDISTGASAEWDIYKNEIRIDPTLPQSQKEAGLIHEIFHVLNQVMTIDNSFHATLESLSEQLYQVLSDNNMLR